jgi:hypothetical protein
MMLGLLPPLLQLLLLLLLLLLPSPVHGGLTAGPMGPAS